jgi:ribosomal protein S18 acetylase RimI-like enzyme
MPLPEMIRIDEQDWEKRRALLADGWREIEVLETYGARITQVGCRPMHPDELDAVMSIARKSFVYDRLHSDETVAKDDADEFKAATVQNTLVDQTKLVIVHGDPIDGFILVRPEHECSRGNKLIVELIAVAERARGKGIAKKLIAFACAMFGASEVFAGTQMRNEAAKGMYESLGWSVEKRERTFHR